MGSLTASCAQFEANCTKMLELARTNGISLRAQTKTHKTVEGAVLQTGGTRRKVVTSTLTECEMYADAGFEDILYGFPHIPAHQERVWRLRERLEEFHLMVSTSFYTSSISSIFSTPSISSTSSPSNISSTSSISSISPPPPPPPPPAPGQVASLETAQLLASSPPPEGKTWSVFLKVECGMEGWGEVLKLSEVFNLAQLLLL